jgi:hypothetical protein
VSHNNEDFQRTRIHKKKLRSVNQMLNLQNRRMRAKEYLAADFQQCCSFEKKFDEFVDFFLFILSLFFNLLPSTKYGFFVKTFVLIG